MDAFVRSAVPARRVRSASATPTTPRTAAPSRTHRENYAIRCRSPPSNRRPSMRRCRRPPTRLRHSAHPWSQKYKLQLTRTRSAWTSPGSCSVALWSSSCTPASPCLRSAPSQHATYRTSCSRTRSARRLPQWPSGSAVRPSHSATRCGGGAALTPCVCLRLHLRLRTQRGRSVHRHCRGLVSVR